MELIGLSGFARSGKDEAAKILVKEFGFVQIAFADKLREMLYQLNPMVGQRWETSASLEERPNTTHVQQVIDSYGWDGYKETYYGPEIRRLIQRLGTEAGRQVLGGDVWIDAALRDLPSDARVVISDARFNNELNAVRSRGGEVWRIERDGVGPANSHASEMEAIEYPHFARTLYNSRGLGHFHNMVRSAYGDFAEQRRPVVILPDNYTSTDENGLRSKPMFDNTPDSIITSKGMPKRR